MDNLSVLKAVTKSTGTATRRQDNPDTSFVHLPRQDTTDEDYFSYAIISSDAIELSTIKQEKLETKRQRLATEEAAENKEGKEESLERKEGIAGLSGCIWWIKTLGFTLLILIVVVSLGIVAASLMEHRELLVASIGDGQHLDQLKVTIISNAKHRLTSLTDNCASYFYTIPYATHIILYYHKLLAWLQK